MLGVRVPPGLPFHASSQAYSGKVSLCDRVTGAMKDFLLKVKDRFRQAIEFIRDVRKELNNVSWPSRAELTGTTVVVIVAVFLFGFFLYLVDVGVGAGMNYLFSRAGRCYGTRNYGAGKEVVHHPHLLGI